MILLYRLVYMHIHQCGQQKMQLLLVHLPLPNEQLLPVRMGYRYISLYIIGIVAKIIIKVRGSL